jgi:lysophospholipase L1-like esterase
MAAAGRPAQPEPFVRGCAWPAGAGVSYPRADPRDVTRLPIDTWNTASLPVGVRLEFEGDAASVAIKYRTETDDFGYRGDGAGRTFALWRDGQLVDEQKAELGEGTVHLSAGSGSGGSGSGGRAIVYLPEGMKPTITEIIATGGDIVPAPAQPVWVAYGDSVAEGWIASGPSGAWPAIAGRTEGLDVRNLGYAGSARGEIVSAEQIATLPADVISISHGTNCWTRIPFSAGMMYETTVAFLEAVRQGHPSTPIVVISPVIRPDAEETPNRFGATLQDLRAAMERAVTECRDVSLIPGRPLLAAENLGDGIHPDDEGHRRLAAAIGPRIREVCRS